MGEGLLKAIERFTKKEEEDVVSFDLGVNYLKGLHLSGNKVKNVFIERNNGQAHQQISSWLKSKNLLSKDIRLAIKGPETLIRYVSFPKVDKKNIKEIFSYEISKFIPFDKDDVYFDISVLDDNYSGKELFILLAVVKKQYLDGVLKNFENLGIKVREINLINVALINLFIDYHARKGSSIIEENAALIDIGFNSTLLNLVKKGIPCLSREIKVSARDFIKRLSRVKNCTLQEAENIVSTLDQPRETIEIQEIIEIIEEITLDLTSEIKNSLDYFEVNWGKRIQAIYLTGGLTGVKGIDNIMLNSLGIETRVWDPFQHLKWELDKGALESKTMLAPVLGLSL